MTAWSEHNPDLQIAWDASSLKNYQFCPRYYQLTNLEGWRGDSTDLMFGRFVASGLELYHKARLDGSTREEAVIIAIKEIMTETWFEDKDEFGSVVQERQWGGHFETMWKCEGTTKYKNQKGNAAKCPFSHKGKWFPGDAPDICVECQSGIRTDRRYIPDSPNKHRISLIRTIIWYGLSQPEDIDDGYRPYVFPDGTKAVELSGRLPLPWKNSYGEQYMLTYNLDHIGQFGTELFIGDNKTTKKTLNDAFFNGYNPDTQFDTYDVIASVAYPDLDMAGVLCEGIQLLVSGVEFGKRIYYKTEEQREEHLNDMHHWFLDAELSAIQGYWRMNKRNCWLCPMSGVCSKPASQRQSILEARFEKQERWDPLQQR